MEQLPQTNPITTSKDSFTPFSPKDLEPPSDILDSEVFLDQEDDSSEETRSRSGIFKKPSDISKKKYHYIPDDLRLKLIDEVENKGEKIKHAAKKLNINYSSAKSICQIYRKEGRSNKKISKRKGLKEEFTKLIQEMKQTGATFGGNSPPVLVNQPPMAEENTQTEASSDTLTALRDRLLQSRAKSRLEYGETPMENNGLEIRKDFSDGIMSQPGDSQQQAYQEPQKPMGFVPANNQGPAKYVTAYMPMQMPQAQTVYYLIPMQNMGYPQAQNAPQQNSMQSFSFGGPSQTININQPQANTISTQSISITNTSSGQQTQSETSFGTQGLYSYGGFNPMGQMNQMIPQQVQPQIQYQQIPVQGQQNGGYMALQQNPQGMQMMRPMIYIMPQNGLNGNGIYQQQQQVPQTNINYYNPNQKLMQFSNGLEGQINQIQNENGNFKQDLIDTQSDQYNIAAKQN